MSDEIIIKKSTIIPNLTSGGNRPLRPRIHGTFPGIQFGEQVLSTGISSLDGYIGNGIPLGAIVIIKDDYPSRYADLVLKTFLAEGATCNHHLFVASGQVDSAKFANELPSLKKGQALHSNTETSTSSSADPSISKSDEMKIAWRYKEASPLPATISSRGLFVKGQKLAKFEFTKKCTAQALGGSHIYISKLDSNEDTDFIPPSPKSLLREIAEQAKLFELSKLPSSGTGSINPSINLLRIGISHCETQVLNPMFMLGLRAIVQHTNSSAVITVSTISCDPKLLPQMENFADMVIQLEAIVDEKKKGELGGVDGLCKIQKINSMNALKLFIPPLDLGFTFTHKRITLQELHLPPEGETTVQRAAQKTHQHHHQPSSTSGCGASRGTSC